MAYAVVTSNKRAITWVQNSPVSVALTSALLEQYCHFANDGSHFHFLQLPVNDDPSFVVSAFRKTRWTHQTSVLNDSVHLQQYYIELTASVIKVAYVWGFWGYTTDRTHNTELHAAELITLWFLTHYNLLMLYVQAHF